MTKLIVKAQALIADRRAVTAVEYGIMAAIIATTLVAVLATFSTNLTTAFTNIGTHLTTGK